MKKKSITKQLEDLVAAVEASDSHNILQGPAVTLYDLSLPYSHMFTPASRLALAIAVKSLSPTRSLTHPKDLRVEVVDRVAYLGVIACGEDKLVKAARVIADAVNKLSAQGLLTGCMAPLSFFAVANEPHELPRYAVTCFVALSEEAYKRGPYPAGMVQIRDNEAISYVV